ncbi:hypothetical protein MAHJHV45_47260 [Mycobacterium avium subsp. hominissuis]
MLTLVSSALHALSLRDPRVHDRLPPRHLDDAQVRAGLGEAAAGRAPGDRAGSARAARC